MRGCPAITVNVILMRVGLDVCMFGNSKHSFGLKKNKLQYGLDNEI